MKVCTKCNETKDLECFFNSKSARDGKSWQCKDCYKIKHKSYYVLNKERMNDKGRQYYADNKDKFRNNKLLKDHGISLKEYNEWYYGQNKVCAICKGNQLPHREYLSVDHCHDTGKVRGLLCEGCNLGLGHFKDNIKALNNAIEYLRRNGYG